MLGIQRAGVSALAATLKNAAKPTLAAHPSRRCLILLLQQSQWKTSCRLQSSSAAAATASSAGALHTPSFTITRKNVVTSSSSSAPIESTLNSSSSSPLTKSPRPQLPPNMVFRAAGHSTLAAQLDLADSESLTYTTNEAATTVSRPLVLLFAWMLSKNTHIEKYRSFWTSRGYDILTVQTSPLDLLLPSLGGRRIALTVYDFLAHSSPRYDQVLVHAFSVGGYQLSEFMYRCSEALKSGQPEGEKVYGSVKGLIIDSCVFADDCAPGLSRAITRNPIGQPLIEASINHFLKATRKLTLERYYKVQAHLFANEMKIPGLLLISRDDIVANVQTNYQLIEGWRKASIPSHIKCWEKSVHVLHYKEHPEEYEFEIDRFLQKIEAIDKVPKRTPVPPPISA